MDPGAVIGTATEAPRKRSHRSTREHEVVVVGGGAGGLAVAARLRRQLSGDIALIEASQKHHYAYLVVAPGIQLNWDAIEGLAGHDTCD